MFTKMAHEAFMKLKQVRHRSWGGGGGATIYIYIHIYVYIGFDPGVISYIIFPHSLH